LEPVNVMGLRGTIVDRIENDLKPGTIDPPPDVPAEPSYADMRRKSMKPK
jgi:hypothetical protein